MLLVFFLFFHFCGFAFSCEIGLTQLRHRDTLALMRCVPTMPGQADPCIVQTGGRMAVCQKYGQDYVCCGSQELLVQLLAGRPTNEKSDFRHLERFSAFRLQCDPNITHFFLKSRFFPCNNNTCSFIKNKNNVTTQEAQYEHDLASAGIRSSDVHFLVITSAYPQFIGNLNLFPDAQVIIEKHFLYKDNVIKGGIEQDVHVELCSSNTYVVSTPGPTANSVSLIAKNVPSMGTVAITGALFVNDDSLTRVDHDFSINTIQLLQSRAEVVCQSDWILPAHSAAFPVTQAMKRMANCA